MTLPKVLIVDDNEDLSRALELRLRANDYEILLAADGAAAIAMTIAQRPIAVLLDMHLEKEEGLAVMRDFQQIPEIAATPIIIVSADCSSVTQHQVLDAGAFSFLEKPVNHLQLLHMLRDIQLRANPDALKAKAEWNSGLAVKAAE